MFKKDSLSFVTYFLASSTSFLPGASRNFSRTAFGSFPPIPNPELHPVPRIKAPKKALKSIFHNPVFFNLQYNDPFMLMKNNLFYYTTLFYPVKIVRRNKSNSIDRSGVYRNTIIYCFGNIFCAVHLSSLATSKFISKVTPRL